MLLSVAWSTRAPSDGVSPVAPTFALLALAEQVTRFQQHSLGAAFDMRAEQGAQTHASSSGMRHTNW